MFLLRPYYNNVSKRLIKSPKLYFYDTGLACFLQGIETAQQLLTYYQRGLFFENMIVANLMKAFYNADRVPRIYFWRAKGDYEIDCIIERAGKAYPIEIKATATVLPELFGHLVYWNRLTHSASENAFLVYGGTDDQKRSLGNVVSWKHGAHIFDTIYIDA